MGAADVGAAGEMFADGGLERAGAVAVEDVDFGGALAQAAVQLFVQGVERLVHAQAAQVEHGLRRSDRRRAGSLGTVQLLRGRFPEARLGAALLARQRHQVGERHFGAHRAHQHEGLVAGDLDHGALGSQARVPHGGAFLQLRWRSRLGLVSRLRPLLDVGDQLLPCARANFALRLGQPLAFLSSLLALPPQLLAKPVCFGAGLPEGGTLRLQSLDRGGQGGGAAAEELARAGAHVRRNSDAGRDLDGRAAADFADLQPVRGCQAAQVEAHAGGREARVREAQRLQLFQVRGDEHLRARPDQLLQSRDRDRGAFPRVRVGGDLVDQHQRARSRRLQDVLERGEVGRERGEVAREVSLVAYRRVHRPVERHRRSVRRWHRQACARHQGGETDRRNGHRLAARVGPAVDQRPRFAGQRHVVRHDLVHAQRQERMPERQQSEALLRSFPKLRRGRAQLVRQLRSRAGLVEAGQRGHVLLQLRGAPAHRAGQLRQDALLLLQRARLGDGELVPQLEQLLGLDEQGLPAAARVVHDARQVRFVLGAHGQDVAVAAHRVVRVAEHAYYPFVREHLLEAGLDGPVQSAGALAQLREQRAGGVEQLSRRIEGPLQLDGERLEVAQRPGQLRVQRDDLLHRQAEPAGRSGGPHQSRYCEQLLRLEGPLAACPAQRRPQIERVGERHLAVQAAQRPRLFHQREPAAGLLRLVAGLQHRAPLPAHRRPCAPGQLRGERGPSQLRQRLLTDHTELHGAQSSAGSARRRARCANRDIGGRSLTWMSRLPGVRSAVPGCRTPRIHSERAAMVAWARRLLEGMRTANAPRFPEFSQAPRLKLVPPPATDGALVAEALGAGQRARLAEEELYRRYRGAVTRLAGSFSELDSDEAEDVVQEAFVRAFRALRSLKDPERFSAWLFTIARNRARSYLSSRATYDKAAEEACREAGLTDGCAPAANEHMEKEAELRAVREVIDGLREGPEKETVRLFYLEGTLSAREIAQRMGVGKSAVTMRLERFRARVRRELCEKLQRTA